MEEINLRADLLPNYTLGYKIFDSCAYPLTGMRAALAVLNGLRESDSPMCQGASPLLAVIGESGSAQSIVVSRILQPFRIPMVKITFFLLIPPKHYYCTIEIVFFSPFFLTDQLLFFMCLFHGQKTISHLLQSNP